MTTAGVPRELACGHCGRGNPREARFCAGCGRPIGATGTNEVDKLIGTELAGRYKVVRPIGEGGMGTVYVGEQPMGTATRKVAIKVLKGAATESARARFLRECETVVQLTHPNTIRFYDFGALPDGRLFIVMEYVEGRTLTKRIEEGPLPYATVDRLVAQIGGALSEAHRRGIVHRDLKPDNVILISQEDDAEQAKVLDFGIAKQRDDAHAQPEITAAGTIVGTPAYMSPEQLTGAEVDARSDLYALGLITFEMLTGRRPFVGKTPLEWATLHMTKPVPSFDEFPSTRLYPAEKRAAIVRALAKEPGERQKSVRRFVEELTGLSSQIAGPGGASLPPIGEAVTTPGPIPVTRGATRSSMTTVLLAALVGASLVVGGWLAFGAFGPGSGAVAVDAGPAARPDAGIDTGPPEPRLDWLQIVTTSDSASDTDLALGPPDGRCAVIRPNGKILFELTPGMPSLGDETPAPELHVYVDEERSGPYRVDVATNRSREDYVNVAAELVGSAPLDVDQVGVGAYRYIRIKNRGTRGIVCLDAIGVYER